MVSFEHSFEEKIFKLTLSVYQRDCHLWFEVYDDNKVYLKSLGYPFNKNRIDELLSAMQGMDMRGDIWPFHFGMDNKSYLLYTGNGILIGQLRHPKTGRREEFKISDLSGLALYDYLLQQVENNSNDS